MTKMLAVTLSFFLPDQGKGILPSIDHLDKLGFVIGDLKKAGAVGVTYNLSNAGEENVGRQLERGAERPGEDRNEDAREVAGRREGTADGNAGSDDDKPKRRPGRPRKSDSERDGGSAEEARRSAAEGSERGGARGEAGQDTQRNVSDRTDEGADEGDRDRAEGRRGSGRSADAERGNREARRISDTPDDRGEQDDGWGDKKRTPAADKGSSDDGWGDNEEDPRLVAARGKGPTSWTDDLLPEDPKNITRDVLTALLSDHFNAAGGKDRNITFDIMEKATGVRKINEVEEKDYVLLARALMWDAARYEFGLNK